jgi:hypothetical protein
MSRSGDFGGNIFGSGVNGGSIEFKPDGRIHHSVFERGSGRMSWDTYPAGDPRNVNWHEHFTDQGYPKNDPGRHPFGR